MRNDDTKTLFLEQMDIDLFNRVIKEFVYFRMEVFFGEEHSYIDNCSIYIGMISEDVHPFWPAANDKGHVLLSGSDRMPQCIDMADQEIKSFELSMKEEVKKSTRDFEETHYTIGHILYQGSGQGRMADRSFQIDKRRSDR